MSSCILASFFRVGTSTGDIDVGPVARLSPTPGAIVSVLAEAQGLGGWIGQELLALLMLVVFAVVLTLLGGAIWLTFKGARDEVVIFEDWGDFFLSFGSVVVIFIGGGLIGGAVEHGLSLVMLIAGLCVGGFGLLLGWSSFERAFEHNGRGGFGVAVGVFKIVAGLLIVLVLIENWKKLTAKESTTGDRIQAGVTIATTGWLAYALVNGERVLAKRAPQGATTLGAVASGEPTATVSGDPLNDGSDSPIPLADSASRGDARVSASPAPFDASAPSAADRKPMTKIGVHKVHESARRVVIRTDGDATEKPLVPSVRVAPSNTHDDPSASMPSSESTTPSPSLMAEVPAVENPKQGVDREAAGAGHSRSETSTQQSPPSRMLPPRIVDRVVRTLHIELEDGSRFGPFTIAELRELAADGRLDGNDRLISPDGSVRLAREVSGLFEA